jgi:hypothetical protein
VVHHNGRDERAAGRLFAFGRGFVTAACSLPGAISFGLYLDNQPVTASGTVGTAGVGVEVSSWGLSDVVAAGSHMLTLKSACAAGTGAGGGTSGDGALGAILLGS